MGDYPVEIFYKEMIQVCENRIQHLKTNKVQASNQLNQSFDFNTQNLSAQRIAELKLQLNSCPDQDLLSALRDEFKRQLESRKIKVQAPITFKPPPEVIEHYYFRKDGIHDGKSFVRYLHFDKEKIARELILQSGQSPQLCLAGRDDPQMCKWSLEEAKIVEELRNEISESEFNSIWFKNGGFPYVRSSRKARRLLTTELFKKH